MKIYIAGKINGDKNYKAKFSAAEELLEKAGLIPLNPACLPQGMTTSEYMRVCFSMLEVCDAVCFLPDYESSEGAMLEYHYCKYTDKPMLHIDAIAGGLYEDYI